MLVSARGAARNVLFPPFVVVPSPCAPPLCAPDLASPKRLVPQHSRQNIVVMEIDGEDGDEASEASEQRGCEPGTAAAAAAATGSTAAATKAAKTGVGLAQGAKSAACVIEISDGEEEDSPPGPATRGLPGGADGSAHTNQQQQQRQQAGREARERPNRAGAGSGDGGDVDMVLWPPPAASSGRSSDQVMCSWRGCNQWVPLAEIDSHELLHRLSAQEQGKPGSGTGSGDASDADLDFLDMQTLQALQGQADLEALREREQADFEALREEYGFNASAGQQQRARTTGHCFTCGGSGHWSPECPHNPKAQVWPGPLSTDPALLATQQRRDPSYKASGRSHAGAKGGGGRGSDSGAGSSLISMLGEVLSRQAGPGYEAHVCGPVAHMSGQHHDRGWGCGFRNIQMMASHLLARERQVPDDGQQQQQQQQHTERQDTGRQAGASASGGRTFRDALFGGCGFLPDVYSLQAWLESAWAEGWDAVGRESLGGKIQGDHKWIGTTEAATLLRFFGVRAHVVDFVGTGLAPSVSGGPRWHRLPDGRACHERVQCDLCSVCPIVGTRNKSLSRPDFDVCEACMTKPEALRSGPYDTIGAPAAPLPPPTSEPSRMGVPSAPSAASAGPSSCVGPSEPSSASATPSSSSADALKLHWPLVQWVWSYFTGWHAPTRHMHPSAAAGPAGTAAAEAGAAAGAAAERGGGEGSRGRVCLTGMPPLYFQHEGHSRTIIGIERRPANRAAGGAGGPAAGARPAGKEGPGRGGGGGGGGGGGRRGGGDNGGSRLKQQKIEHFLPAMQANAAGSAGVGPQYEDEDGYVYTLLVLDPSVPSKALDDALRSNSGWQRLLRRGLHTLTKPQYQVCYVLGSLCGSDEERQGGKVMRATEVVRPVPL